MQRPVCSRSGSLQQSLLGAVRTENVRTVGDEALAHQVLQARRTAEAVVVPVPVLEAHELGAANTYGK